MQVGEKIKLKRVIRGKGSEERATHWRVKKVSDKLVLLDNNKYFMCLNLGSFIEQSDIKVYIERAGEYIQLKARGLCDLRKL